MSASLFIIKPEDLRLNVQAEYASLKDAEKGLRDMPPGSYLVVQVVRQATLEEVPSTVRVQVAATRTRAPRDPNAPKKPRKPRAPKADKAN